MKLDYTLYLFFILKLMQVGGYYSLFSTYTYKHNKHHKCIIFDKFHNERLKVQYGET